MSKWIAEFDLEDGDTMPEHMDLEYKGVKIDFHCRPKEPILDKILAEVNLECISDGFGRYVRFDVLEKIIDKYKAESESQENGCKGWLHKPCINYEDGCEEWAGCPCVYYKAGRK